jgi:aldehyde dehydrogenase (NAD(P)+)
MSQIELDQIVSVLIKHQDEWARLPVGKKRAMLIDLRQKTGAIADRWVKAAIKAKGIEDQPNLAVEEWLGGPYAVLLLLNELIHTLRYLENGQTRPLKKVRTRPGPEPARGQVVVDMFPLSAYDRILFNGMHGEIWMQPDVTPANLVETMAPFYRQVAPEGKVALVLGAGNVASLSITDVLHKLYTEGQVCLLKMNPINDYLGVFFEEIFAAFCQAGYVQFAYGGAEVGAYLTAHPGIDEIHMTGGARTHDAIVYGTGPEGAERKRQNQPVNTKRITSELGCVTPTIVVPGPWTEAELRYQAEHIVTQKHNNAGHNCLASQVLILSAGWDKTPALLDAIRAVIRDVPLRPSYYPGTTHRYQAVLAAHPDAEVLDSVDHARDDMLPRLLLSGLDHTATDMCFTEELFSGVLAEIQLPATGPAEFLQQAVRFANETLDGTLSANLIVHPRTAKALGSALEEAIAELRYGSVGINCWAAYGWLFPMLTWGAFPGHSLNNIQSGIGVVHNSFMFDQPQKSVLYAPFVMKPKPPFVTHRNGDELGRRMVDLEASQSLSKLPGVILAAVKG